jgi:hypothetical protein
VESQYASTHSRFSASAAYFELVDKRIADIAESRLAGLQTIGEFMDRRLSPARSTCQWATRRQDALSQRVSRISNLLRTRVEIEQQQSSQALLGAMNRRQGLQLKLQSTVEGLSVAAITYYIAGLVSYLAKGAQVLGWPFSPESTAACRFRWCWWRVVVAAAAAQPGVSRLIAPRAAGRCRQGAGHRPGTGSHRRHCLQRQGHHRQAGLPPRVDAVTLIMYRMLFALPIFASWPGGPAAGREPLTRRDWLGVLGWA